MAGGPDRLQQLVAAAVTDALSVALPVAVKLVEHQVERRLFASQGPRALFHDWGHR